MILQVGSLDSSISIIQECAGNTNSQDHPRPTESDTLQEGQEIWFNGGGEQGIWIPLKR